MSIIILSDTTIAEPPGGTLTLDPPADIHTGLRWSLSADSIEAAPGDVVSSWVAEGSAPLLERSFVSSGSWAPPSLELTGPSGRPCVQFEGEKFQRIRNAAGVIGPIPQPHALALVVRIDARTGLNGLTRIVSAPIGNTRKILFSPSGGLQASAGSGAMLAPGFDGWGVIVMVFNGGNSRMAVNGVIYESTEDIGTEPGGQLMFGGAPTTPPSPGSLPTFSGAFREILAYDRYLYDSDIVELTEVLSTRNGISF